MPRIRTPAGSLLLLALCAAAATARAQTAEVGANVYLFQPGPIHATLLAAPGAPSYTVPGVTWWEIGIKYNIESTPRSSYGLFQIGLLAVFGETSATTPVIPNQGPAPLVFRMTYVPPESTSSAEDIVVSTGSNPGEGARAVYETAAVLFGPDNTAEIGFAPVGMTIGSFSDYPFRIGLTNVSSLVGGGC